MSSHKPYTVIGAGLAGTLTCLELVRRDQSVRWVIDPGRPACSNVAAGMYNPITGKRFAKTWQVDVLQPFMESYYRDVEKLIGATFLYPQPVMKLFTDSDESDRWLARKDDKEFKRLAKPLESADRPAGVRDLGFGGFIVPNAGSVRVAVLLEAVKSYLEQRVEIYRGIYSSDMTGTIIHCNGWRGVENVILKNIPFRHAHGDVLTIEAQGLGDSHILNTGVYILPLEQNRFRIGATYDWNRLDPSPTEEGRKELEARLDELLDIPYSVIAHDAGIRPATKRRTPVLGRLPEQPDHAVFNGLGSKGVLLAPYYTRQLVEHLLDEKQLDREVDVRTHVIG